MAVSYTTSAELRQFSAGMEAQVRKRMVEAAETREPTHATFLSHSSKDVDLLAGAVLVLENHGASVYIDKKDATLPPYTSRETASLLKERIASSKKFVLLASVNSKDSRWVPWELGLADGNKANRNVAVFPSVESRLDTAWTEQEYLGVYDRIIWGDLNGYDKPLWLVLNSQANTASTLSNWLAR